MENVIVGDIDNMARESFLVLAMRTEFQRDAMKIGNGKEVCTDATHGTNVYNFLLITVMVIDNSGEGIPSAGALTPLVFMSDDAEQYYCAWCGVFCPVPKKCFCSWHVDIA
uniref:MULE transposase domain-containing protein n=1 Tax=Amphimedon queenslandica TaxID=400682 RepID=A0A1X7V4U4_AMPQE